VKLRLKRGRIFLPHSRPLFLGLSMTWSAEMIERITPCTSVLPHGWGIVTSGLTEDGSRSFRAYSIKEPIRLIKCCSLRTQNRQAVVDGSGESAASRDGKARDFAEGKVTKQRGIVRLSEFDQKLGHTRIHNSLIVQQSYYWPEVENQPNVT